MPLVATAKSPHPSGFGVMLGRPIKMKNVPPFSEVDLLYGHDLLCHGGFAFIAFLLLGVIMQRRLHVVHPSGAPIDVHRLERTLWILMHEWIKELLYACVVGFLWLPHEESFQLLEPPLDILFKCGLISGCG